MKALPTLLVVAVLAIVLSVLFLRDTEEAAAGLELHQAPLSTSTEPVDPDGLGIEAATELSNPNSLSSRKTVDALAAADSPIEASAAVDFDGPWTRVEGRVVDQEGAPLEGTRVQLIVYKAPEGAGLQELPRLGNEAVTRRRQGVQALADASGQFALDAPFGPKTTYRLKVAADRFHDSATLRFGRGGVQPVIEGVVYVDEIRLATTGSIFGMVTDVRGQPLANVEMGTGAGVALTYSRGSLSNEDGSFVIPHAIIGTYMVKAELEGFLSKRIADVAVQARQDTGPVDIVLEDAPRIEGRIVNEDNVPIKNVRLWGWPDSSGSGAGARTKADGSFVVYLPQAEPYTMEATHPDYEQWGDDDGEQFEPGTNLGTIILTRASQVSFTVADETSGESLSTFGLSIGQNEGSGNSSGRHTQHRLPRLKDHADGVFTAGATPLLDSYIAYAPGFLMKEGDVLPTDESIKAGTPEQRILLDRGAGVEGRLVLDGDPLSGVSIKFTPGSNYKGFSPHDHLAFEVKTGSDGRFRTTGLRPRGKTRLTARRPEGGAPLVIMLEGLEGGAVRDLGNLEFLGGGTVVGQVLLPASIDPGGITIYRGDWKEDMEQVTDSTGVFRFENVPAGETSFGQRGRPEVFTNGGTVKAVVEPGTVTEVVLDLRDQALVDVAIEIDLGTLPVGGLPVALSTSPPEQHDRLFSFGSNRGIQLGTTDEQGVVRGRCHAVKDVRVEVTLPHGQRLFQDGGPISIAFGPPFTERVGFSVNSLVVDLGSYRSQLADGTLSFGFAETVGLPLPNNSIDLPLTNGELESVMDGWATLVGSEVTLHGVPEGEWEITVYTVSKDALRVTTELPSEGSRTDPKREFEFSSNVTIRPGETTRLEGPPR